jgi:predicted nucleic acid-binding Zn ribbon protein
LLSSAAIQFKGSGWYVTDYAKKSGGPAGSKAEDSNGDKKPATAPSSPTEPSKASATKH